MSHDNNFNFLRLVLATSVIVTHSLEFSDGSRRRDPLNRLFDTGFTLGDMAVNGFFLLSGYLIFKSWNSQPRLWPFLKKRVLRIYPAFAAASLASAFLFGPLAGNPNYWSELSVTVVARRIVMLGLPGAPDSFPDLHVHTVNGSLWSIRYEFICYLAVALLGLARLSRSRGAIVALWASCTAINLYQCVTGTMNLPGLGDRSMAFGAAIRPFSFFLAGVCFALFAERVRYTGRGVLAALALLIPCMFQYTFAQAALPVLGGYLLFAAAFANWPLLKGFRKGADVSYGVYLYAWPIQLLIMTWFRHMDAYVLMMVTFAVSLVFGIVSWHLVEHPFLRLKPKPAPAPPVATNDQGLVVAKEGLLRV